MRKHAVFLITVCCTILPLSARAQDSGAVDTRASTKQQIAQLEALCTGDTPFDKRIHEIRRQPGQLAVAAQLTALLRGSRVRASHLHCERVQDPYSLRCQPQVVGACLDQLRHAALVLLREANAVTDNPLVVLEHTGEQGEAGQRDDG